MCRTGRAGFKTTESLCLQNVWVIIDMETKKLKRFFCVFTTNELCVLDFLREIWCFGVAICRGDKQYWGLSHHWLGIDHINCNMVLGCSVLWVENMLCNIREKTIRGNHPSKTASHSAQRFLSIWTCSTAAIRTVVWSCQMTGCSLGFNITLVYRKPVWLVILFLYSSMIKW